MRFSLLLFTVFVLPHLYPSAGKQYILNYFTFILPVAKVPGATARDYNDLNQSIVLNFDYSPNHSEWHALLLNFSISIFTFIFTSGNVIRQVVTCQYARENTTTIKCGNNDLIYVWNTIAAPIANWTECNKDQIRTALDDVTSECKQFRPESHKRCGIKTNVFNCHVLSNTKTQRNILGLDLFKK